MLDDFDPDGPCDSDTLFGLPHTPDNAAVVVVPVPFEATTSYGKGTASGPAAILAASAQVDLHDVELGDIWRAGIAMAPADPDLEAWNAAACAAAETHDTDTVDALGDQMVERVGEHVRAIFERGAIPAVLGGDHSVPLGAIREAARRHPGLGILHVDAHADLRVAYEGYRHSHASILHNVLTTCDVGPVAQVGLRDVGAAEVARIAAEPRLHALFDADVAWRLADGETWRALCDALLAPLPRDIWVTFDIDGLDPALCPHTGTPVPGGLSWQQALALLRAVRDRGHRVVGFDLVEVAPGDDEWDANVGARLLYKLAGTAIRTRETP